MQSFWNTDPVIHPWQSPYSAFNNNPIYFIDPDGREGVGSWLKNAWGSIKSAFSGNKEKVGFESGRGTPENPIQGPAFEITAERGTPTTSGGGFWNKVGNAFSGVKNWWNNSELFFSARGKIDVGAQAGGHIQILNQKLALEGNLVSFDVIGAGVEQRGNSNNPHEWSFDYLGEDGYLKVNQGAEGSVPIFGGAKYEHNFEGRLAGGYRNETHTTTITATAIQYQNKQIVKSAMSVNELKFSVGARIALIGGAEINVEFGVKDKE